MQLPNKLQRPTIAAAILLLLGLSGFFYSKTLPTYKDESLYQSQYQALSPESSDDATEMFRELRKSQLTSKYKIQDYSLTVAAISLIALAFSFLSARKISAPESKPVIAGIGIVAALTTSAASASDLFLAFQRGDFPWWADTLTIPLLSQELPLFIVLVSWALIHLLFLRGTFTSGQEVLLAANLKVNYWLSLMAVISFISLLNDIFSGRFMMVIPGSLWIYFYLSLASGLKKNA